MNYKGLLLVPVTPSDGRDFFLEEGNIREDEAVIHLHVRPVIFSTHLHIREADSCYKVFSLIVDRGNLFLNRGLF